MRHPLRQAFWGFLVAAIGAMGAVVLFMRNEPMDDVWLALLGGGSFVAMPIGLVWGVMALLAAIGEARLRSGTTRIAQWEVSPADWEAFRTLDTARATEGPGLAGDYAPRPADGRRVSVMFSRRQVIVDDHYSPLRRFAVPELMWVNWLDRPGLPECLEFGLLSASESTSVRTALRVPVPAAAREDGVRMFHHFQRVAPKPKVGLAFRRPWLVIGSSLGVAAVGLLVAGLAWLLQRAGHDDDALVFVLALGIGTAIAAGLIAAMVLLIVRPWRQRG